MSNNVTIKGTSVELISKWFCTLEKKIQENKVFINGDLDKEVFTILVVLGPIFSNNDYSFFGYFKTSNIESQKGQINILQQQINLFRKLIA